LDLPTSSWQLLGKRSDEPAPHALDLDRDENGSLEWLAGLRRNDLPG
jgi:hypothetical protein